MSAETWLSAKNTICKNASIVVVKVGSAVITNEEGLAIDVLTDLADQITALGRAKENRRIVLVTSGAVAAGRSILKKHGMTQAQGLAAKQAIAAIGQAQLMQAWDSVFQKHKKATAQVLLTRDDLISRQRFLNVRNTFSELLDWNVLPIVNENDTVSVDELKFGDNDSLSSLLVNLVHAELLVNLTQAPGVYALDPSTNPSAEILDHIDDIQKRDLSAMCGSKTSVGTGGMYAKLRAARRTAQLGVPTLILPGRSPNILERAFAQDATLGTYICPDARAIPRRKYWLAYQRDPMGTLTVDSGAAKALLYEGRSLLPGGITEVSGSFQKGALVAIRSESKEIGVGLTNYSAQDLARIKGLKRHEVAAILGNAHYPDVIHRDNMLLNAVV